MIDSHGDMGTILVVRDDAERVTSTPARAELGSGVRAQNKTAAAHGGEEEGRQHIHGRCDPFCEFLVAILRLVECGDLFSKDGEDRDKIYKEKGGSALERARNTHDGLRIRTARVACACAEC